MAYYAMFPSNFLKSLCAQNFLWATFYQHSSISRTPCRKYAQTHFLKENLRALQVFLCALSSRPVCARTRTQLRGNIATTVILVVRSLVHLVSLIAKRCTVLRVKNLHDNTMGILTNKCRNHCHLQG